VPKARPIVRSAKKAAETDRETAGCHNKPQIHCCIDCTTVGYQFITYRISPKMS